jgi:hypothetical protein
VFGEFEGELILSIFSNNSLQWKIFFDQKMEKSAE